MIFRLSQKLATKIHERPEKTLPLDANPRTDWTGHLFTAGRAQYILVTNTASLYSTLFLGRGITNDQTLLWRARDAIREVMDHDGLKLIHSQFVARSTDKVRFSKALNRSVTGSMNDMVQITKFLLADGDLSPFEISFRLNDMPMSMLEYAKPREVIKQHAKDLAPR